MESDFVKNDSNDNSEKKDHDLALPRTPEMLKEVVAEEVSLTSARIVDSRIIHREDRRFVQYKLQIETTTLGTLYVWHRYSTFRNLAGRLNTMNGSGRERIPELPSTQLSGTCSNSLIQDRVAKLNQFLEAATKAKHLQWGIRIDQDTCVYKRRVKTPLSRESMKSGTGCQSFLNSELLAQHERRYGNQSSDIAEYVEACFRYDNLHEQGLQNKRIEPEQTCLISAKVVDSRITYREDSQFVEYKLQIETTTRGTLYVWCRYSTFRKLADMFHSMNSDIPNIHSLAIDSDPLIRDRVEKLNKFLEAATKDEYLHWGIRIDQDTCVYKQRNISCEYRINRFHGRRESLATGVDVIASVAETLHHAKRQLHERRLPFSIFE